MRMEIKEKKGVLCTHGYSNGKQRPMHITGLEQSIQHRSFLLAPYVFGKIQFLNLNEYNNQ